MRRRSGKGQAGFIITLELVLIFTILGLGLTVGIVAIRNALFKFFLTKRAAAIYVVDSDPAGQKVLGKALDLDEHEAPRLQFVDSNVDFGGVTVNRRVILGVRDDRFTSRHRIFYEDSTDCGNAVAATNVCIVSNGNEDGDNRGTGVIALDLLDSASGTVSGSAELLQAGGIGYLYPMQGGPSYGIGRDVDSGTGFPGTLYREDTPLCDPAQIRSVWTSQEVVSGEPCLALDAGVTVTAAKCPPGSQGDALHDPCDVPPADSRCVTTGTCGVSNTGCSSSAECPLFPGDPLDTCNTASLQCACPETDNGVLSDNWVETGSNCCPPGSDGTTQPGQCIIGNNGQFRVAEPVINNAGANALSVYVAPFRVSLPVEVDATFQANAPGGFEGAPPGAVIPGGTDVDTIDYAAPADSEEGPP